MKNLIAFRFPLLAVSAALIGTSAARAADTIEIHWSDVCELASSGDSLILTTVDGSTVEGHYCVKVNADEIAATTRDHQTIRIARAALSGLRVSKTAGHQLKSPGKDLRKGLRTEVRWLLSPMAPFGLVLIPLDTCLGRSGGPFLRRRGFSEQADAVEGN